MDLLLCRHGEASFDAPSDRLRVLTERGIKDTNQRLSDTKALLASATRLWSSDYLRAQQTANIFSEALTLEREEQNFLRPDSSPQRVVSKLAAVNEDDTLLVVAHMPLLGELVSLLTEGHCYASYGFATSEIVHLRGDLLEAGLCSIVPR